MKYPYPVMRLSELRDNMHFPEEWLLYIYRMRSDRKIAWKGGPGKNSPILFDTEELEKYRKAQCTNGR